MDQPTEQSGVPDAGRFKEMALAALPAVARFARRLARNAADGDDLAQEAYLKAFNAACTFAGDTAAMRSWLFRIVHNIHRSRFRNHHTRRQSRSDSTQILRDAAARERADEQVFGMQRDLATANRSASPGCRPRPHPARDRRIGPQLLLGLGPIRRHGRDRHQTNCASYGGRGAELRIAFSDRLPGKWRSCNTPPAEIAERTQSRRNRRVENGCGQLMSRSGQWRVWRRDCTLRP